MKKSALASFLFIALALAPLAAQQKAAEKPAAPKPAAAAAAAPDMAFLFSFTDLVSPFGTYDDGFLTGAGFKYWFVDRIAGRALLNVAVEPDPVTEEHETSVSLSVAGEYHFRRGKASPYAGAILGFETLMDTTGNYLDYCVGAMGGVEIRVFENLALFAEYQALLTGTINGIAFNLGDRAVLGFAVYF